MVVEDFTQYHVTLRFPVAVKLSGTPFLVRCFDATIAAIDQGAGTGAPSREFRVVRIWGPKGDTALTTYRITQTLVVPADNIAGLVVQPFEAK